MAKYHFTTTVQMPIEQAKAATVAALGSRGFGVLTEIDVKGTLKNKLGVDFRPYLILGACNPGMAYKALQAEEKIGTMLLCNVILQQRDDGQATGCSADRNEGLESANDRGRTRRAGGSGVSTAAKPRWSSRWATSSSTRPGRTRRAPCWKGEERRAHIFVAVLGASNYTYAEGRWSEALPEWIGVHVNAFAAMGDAGLVTARRRTAGTPGCISRERSASASPFADCPASRRSRACSENFHGVVGSPKSSTAFW
jgi:uncharacterized protein (DUF302 family)